MKWGEMRGDLSLVRLGHGEIFILQGTELLVSCFTLTLTFTIVDVGI
jgi:hypothetical protein